MDLRPAIVLLLLVPLAFVPDASACSILYSEGGHAAALDGRFVFDRGIDVQAVHETTGFESTWTDYFFLRLQGHGDALLVEGQQGLGAGCEGTLKVALLDGAGNVRMTWDAVAGALSGDHLIVARTTGGLLVVDLDDLSTMRLDIDAVTDGSARVATSGQHIVVVDGTAGTWALYDLQGEHLAGGLDAGEGYWHQVVFSPAGGHVAILSGDEDVEISVWSVPVVRSLWTWTLDGEPTWPPASAAWAGDLLFASAGGDLWTFDLEHGQATARSMQTRSAAGLAGDGDQVLVAWRDRDHQVVGVGRVDADAAGSWWRAPGPSGLWLAGDHPALSPAGSASGVAGGPAGGPGGPDGEEPSPVGVVALLVALALASMFRRR